MQACFIGCWSMNRFQPRNHEFEVTGNPLLTGPKFVGLLHISCDRHSSAPYILRRICRFLTRFPCDLVILWLIPIKINCVERVIWTEWFLLFQRHHRRSLMGDEGTTELSSHGYLLGNISIFQKSSNLAPLLSWSV